MANSLPLQIAETIQTASIRHNPTVERDLAPSTAADTRIPVVIEKRPLDENEDEDDDPLGLDGGDLDDLDDEDTDDEKHYSVIRPWDPAIDSQQHRHQYSRAKGDRPHIQLPPLPDLRFEQSYLRSINTAVAENAYWKVALITVRDQLLMPFVQGLVYNVGIFGWQSYNRRATLSGQSMGARARRWWYGVNNWPIPAQTRRRY